jgi:hypothetical protein
MLHPTRLGKNLSKLALGRPDHAAGLIEQYRPRAGGALVYRQNVTSLHGTSLARMLREE